ncbi:hypothetical protein KU6B_20070 [Mameliella alba]|nr:hypothetical protein KU6B_20070 [Mameliella alba]
MKTLTILQAAALLMLAVIGAYAGQDAAAQPCAAPSNSPHRQRPAISDRQAPFAGLTAPFSPRRAAAAGCAGRG